MEWFYYQKNYKKDILDIILNGKSNSKSYNEWISFDIETTSMRENEKPVAFMYTWCIRVGEVRYIGRYWTEFVELLEYLVKNTNLKIKLYIFVQNLAFEWQFLKFYLKKVTKMFASGEDKPYYFDIYNLHFQCTYKMTNLSLYSIGKTVGLDKLVGDLDYLKIRHSLTPLTDEEIGYILRDVDVIHAYIKKSLQIYKSLHNIPITSTGRIRKLLKDRITSSNERYSYFNSIHKMYSNEYIQIRKVFAGGHSHASHNKVEKIIENVKVFDESSAYPFAMVGFKFPNKLIKYCKTLDDISYYSKNNFVICDVRVKNLRPKFGMVENIISIYKCRSFKNSENKIDGKFVVNNNKLYSADEVAIPCTNFDLEMYHKFYDFDVVNYENVFVYNMEYLPKTIIELILELFENKTKLKGVKDMEDLYLNSKELLNSLYGMCATSCMFDEYDYNDKTQSWNIKRASLIPSVEDYNKNKNRVLNYIWGCAVTSYNRCRLWEFIYRCGMNYCYSDTDSVFTKDFEGLDNIVEELNTITINQLKDMCNHYTIDFNRCTPKTNKGKTKVLGIWEHEMTCTRAKFLGSKRYLLEYIEGEELKYKFTIAGIPKNNGLKFLKFMAKIKSIDIFDTFTPVINFPSEFPKILDNGDISENDVDYLGLKTKVSSDEECFGTVTDYTGITAPYEALSYIFMENCGKVISEDTVFTDFLDEILNEEVNMYNHLY